LPDVFRFLLAAACCAAAAAQAGTFAGVVSHVSDGDSLWVRPADGPPVRVRLLGIDAPERCQAHGREAREALAGRVLHQRVTVRARATDDYERTLARVDLHGEDVGAWMVSQGWAWSQRWRGRATVYAAQEEAARRERRGLWRQDEPVPPRDFRQRHGPCAR
jgi:micrococcal nuclease